MSPEEHGRHIGERIRAAERARLERLVALHPQCPVDGLPSDYVGIMGSFGTARFTFMCPNQDAFTWNHDTGQTRVIPPSDHRFIRRETFDLLMNASQEELTRPIEPGEPDTSAVQDHQLGSHSEQPNDQSESPHT